jgi:hypothetical protein
VRDVGWRLLRGPSQGYVMGRQGLLATTDILSKGMETLNTNSGPPRRELCGRLVTCSSRERVTHDHQSCFMFEVGTG